MTTVPEAGYLRRKDIYHAVRSAMTTSMAWSRTHDRFRICHMSIQGNHIHLIAEADSKTALSRGMQGFTISCARHINAALSARQRTRRTGRVFRDRYHARALRTPTEVRNCIAYVLSNWRHHGTSRSHGGVKLDPYSTAATFGGWTDSPSVYRVSPETPLLPVWLPRSWLLREGWRRHGLISPTAVPGGTREPNR